jgi:tyrosyl-tRNA synthetase
MLSRGAVQIIDRPIWEEKKVRVKFGIDPTNTKVHFGHLVPLLKLRQFQQCGHSVHLIIGTCTACVGDPSGRDKGRMGIDLAKAKENATEYINQIARVLDVTNLQVHFNHTWFAQFNHLSWMELLGHVTAQQLLRRDDFANRMDAANPITMKEMLYPVMQAWDSCAIHAEVEIGGTEQLFNLQLGRHIQAEYGQPPQVIMTLPLLRGLDGVKKMGKSQNNFIALDEEPFEMFSKVMSISDEMMPEWYKLLTDRDPVFLPESMFTLKKQLAYLMVELLHGVKNAIEAQDRWHQQFSLRADPEYLPEINVPGEQASVVDLLMLAGFAPSKSAARRLIEPNSCVSIGERNNRITDTNAVVVLQDGMVLRAGNRRICRIKKA